MVLAGLLLWLTGCEQQTWQADPDAELPEGPHVGMRAPRFEVPIMGGEGFRLEEYRGRVLLINFWATWCIPCRAEMPSMERLYQEFGGKHFEIVAISGGESPMVVHPFVTELRLSFPILLDRDFEVHGRYQVTAIPSSYLVDRSGVITNRYFGAVDWDHAKLRDLVAKLIKHKA